MDRGGGGVKLDALFVTEMLLKQSDLRGRSVDTRSTHRKLAGAAAPFAGFRLENQGISFLLFFSLFSEHEKPVGYVYSVDLASRAPRRADCHPTGRPFLRSLLRKLPATAACCSGWKEVTGISKNPLFETAGESLCSALLFRHNAWS